jgi:hypothetical protein
LGFHLKAEHFRATSRETILKTGRLKFPLESVLKVITVRYRRQKVKTKKLVAMMFVCISVMAVSAAGSANVVSFSQSVPVSNYNDTDVTVHECPASLTYDFLSTTVSLSQFDPSLGTLNSVELVVASAIDVKTVFSFDWDSASTTQWWYSNVTGNVNQLQAKIFQAHNNQFTGRGDYLHDFTINGTAWGGSSSGLTNFIGTGTVDVNIVGDNMLCAWWNDYFHRSTSTGGTVTAKLIYNYTAPDSVEPCLTVMDDLSMFVPCAEYEGAGYSFMLNYFENPDDAHKLYWKMDLNTFTSTTSTSCIDVNRDLSLVIPCASFMGAGYGFGFTLDLYLNPSDPSGLYWVMDWDSFTGLER